MQSVDTNVLVRILVDDDKQVEQVKAARKYAKKAGQLFITQIVQVELIWVLEVAYDINKEEIIMILHHLIQNEAFILQNESQFLSALHLYQTTSADFSDCLIWAVSHEEQCNSIVTFDKKFARLENMILLH